MDVVSKPKRKSKVQIYLHFVWTTKARKPLLAAEIERSVHRCIALEAVEMGCEVIALDGTEDHVHMLVKSPSKVAPALIAQKVKGVSSNMVDDTFPQHAGFYWQKGYGVFSVSRWDLDRVADYVKGQKAHHSVGTLIPELEETDEPWP